MLEERHPGLTARILEMKKERFRNKGYHPDDLAALGIVYTPEKDEKKKNAHTV